MPTLSLILPVYNRYHLMRAALSSIARQSVPPDEIVVVDDGSTDGDVQDLVRGFAMHNLRYVRIERAEEYRNSSRPYNVGIRAATQEAVVYCAAELIHLPLNFQYLRRVLKPETFVVGGTVLFEAEKTPLPQAVRFEPEKLWMLDFDVWHPRYHGLDHRHFLLWNSRSGVHAVYRHHLLEIRGFEESLTAWGHNDAQMRRRLVKLKGLREVRVPQVITIHPYHPRPPKSNMDHSTADRLLSEVLPLVVNEGREWGMA